LGLQVAFGAFRPKPQFEQFGLQVAFGAFRPKPHFEQLGLQVAFRPKPQFLPSERRMVLQPFGVRPFCPLIFKALGSDNQCLMQNCFP
jgi:hypothetical protein